MKGIGSVELRDIEPSDLDPFFRHQLDRESQRMAAFVGEDPGDRAAFNAHWKTILGSALNVHRTIIFAGRVAGHISFYPSGDDLEVTYWLGREFWGQGVATQALKDMLALVVVRPIVARAAADNVPSIRVLQKCGFTIVGTNRDFANGRGEVIEECLFRLD